MTTFDIYQNKNYEDSFGHVYSVDFSADVMTGGQGVVLRTTETDLALKIIRDPDTNAVILNDRNNDKYLSLRILPIPHGLKITLPQATLKGVEGYVMTLLNSMTEFVQAFSLCNRKKNLADALSGNASEVNQPLLKFFESEKLPPAKQAKIYEYMRTGGLRRRLMAYMKAAAILVRLHTSGLVYCDFSDKNAFISTDLNYSHVWLIDADNLEYSELLRQGFYTPGFGAPEIIRGEAGCSFYSDSFSFAVALFNTLFDRYPFDGQAYQDALSESGDVADELRERGEFAWILDADDDSNDGRKFLFLPDEFILSDGLRDLFQQMFLPDACQDPTIRPTMIQWVRETALAFDNVIYSKNCGLDFLAGENFSLCPYSAAQIPTIRLKSFLTDADGNKLSALWKFTHELTEEQIDVPLRILNGFACRELEKVAFVLSFRDGRILIRAEATDFSFAYADGRDAEAAFKNYGSFWVEQKFFSIKCRHKNGRCVLVEGERDG